MRALFTTLLGLMISVCLLAQTETNKMQFRFAAIGSMPDDTFGSESVSNEDAGFAKFGGGVELGFKFFLSENIFVPLSGSYIGRQSTFIETLVNFQNALPNGEQWRLESDAKWRHGLFNIGLGYEFGNPGFRIAPSFNVGFANTILTESSIRTPQGIAQFDRSTYLTFLYGASLTFIIDQALFIEASFVNVGRPTFQLIEDMTSTNFSIPVRMINFKLGFLLFNGLRKEGIKP